MSEQNVFRIERNGSTLVLTPRCNISSLATENMQPELQTLQAIVACDDVKDVVVDFDEVPHFGSEMLGAIHMIWKRIRADGGKLVICNVSRVGREILQVAKFDLIWPIYESRSEALAALS